MLTVLSARGTTVNKVKILILMDLKFQWEEMKIKYVEYTCRW